MKKSNYKRYYSYSRLWQYLKDPQEYYRKYIMGMWDPPNQYMALGSIFALAYADPKFDVEDAILNPKKYIKDLPNDIVYTPDFVRIMKQALIHPEIIRLPKHQCEQSIRIQSKICPVMSKTDGFDEKKMLIIENKYGSCWNEERANSEDQITFYAWIAWLKYGVIPVVRVQTFDKKSGKLAAFNVIKHKTNFAPLEEKIEYAYKGIISQDWEIKK